MKNRRLTRIGMGLALAIAPVVAVAQPAEAGADKYFCAELGGIYRTFARTPRGNVPMISWVSNTNPEWPSRRRCIEVSKRFERYYDNGMRYLGTGIVNNESVLCAVRQQGNACNEDNLLVTLSPGMDRHQAAQRLLDMRGLAAGRILELNGEQVARTVNGEIYYNIDQWLNQMPAEEATLTPEGE